MPDGLQDYLDELAATIRRSVSVDDAAGGLLGYSTHGDHVDPARVNAILARRIAPAVLAWQDQHGIATATTPVRLPPNPELAMTGRLCVPIRDADTVLGYLWVSETDAAMGPDETAAAVRTAGLVHRDLLADRHRRGGDGLRGLDRLLRELIELDPAAPAAVAERFAAAAPAVLDGPVRVAVVHPGAPPAAAADVARRIALASRGHVAGYPAGADVVLLFAGDPRSAGAERALVDLAGAVRDIAAQPGLGLSEPARFGGPELRRLHRQAMTAARLSAADPALPQPCSWADLGVYRTLVAADPDPVAVLHRLDESGSSAAALAHTLEVYLDLAGDAQRTTRALSLHRTTLYYRLRRIAELLGVDLADGLTRTELHVALKQRRLRRAGLG